MSFFTPDCFHFTIKGHEELAKGLWNNMVSLTGEKDLKDVSLLKKALEIEVCCSQIKSRLFESAPSGESIELFC